MTDDYDGQGNGDGGRCGPGVTALDYRATQRAMQDIGPLARELGATMNTVADSWKPLIGIAPSMTAALGGDHRSVFKALQDVSGATSAAEQGSVLRHLMGDAESSVGASIKSMVESWKPLIGIAPSMTAALGGDHRSVFKALQDVSGATSAAEQGSVLRHLMGDAESSVGASIKSMVESWKPLIGIAPSMTTALAGSIESITEQMRSWSRLAESGYRIARLALRMALAAQDAVKRGDREAVKEFMLGWLGFKEVSWDLLNSASLVLLDSRRWLPEGESVLDCDPSPKLRKLTLEEHRRCHRLLTDPNLVMHGKPILSLSTPVSPENPQYTLLDNLADKPRDDGFCDEDINDPRVLRVLAKLTERERNIVAEQGHVGTTWADAAVACGGTPYEGESLRRKVKRLSKLSGGESAQGGRSRTAEGVLPTGTVG